MKPQSRSKVVRPPVEPDLVAQGIVALQVAYPERRRSIDQFLGLWWRIRGMSYLELNQRLACARSITHAARLSGWRKRDLQSLVLCLFPWGLRTHLLARSRGWRPAA
ncbi:MAG: hypothetical protein QM749_18065 [Aquabacterium sp.]